MNLDTIHIRPADSADIDAIEALYDAVNDFLAVHDNYPGWQKGIYPARIHAETGVAERTLYVAEAEACIVGSVILNHAPEENYDMVKWLTDAADEEAYVVHTLAVHPVYQSCGIGERLLAFACDRAKADGMKSVRLDVTENHRPAIRLYEKLGFTYMGTIDIGLAEFGLPWFKVYEKTIT